MLSGNTDCYQPAERKFKLTRQILEVFWKHRHHLKIITKNALIVRDLDLLSTLANQQLLQVAISITTLNEKMRLKLEPRTASGKKLLDIITKLSEANIPTILMMAPIIPSLNDHEINNIAALSAAAGALQMHYTIIRLNGAVSDISKDWLIRYFPDRHDRIIRQIEQYHGGKVNDSQFGRRMKGAGPIAAIINQQIKLARVKHFSNTTIPKLNLELYSQHKPRQLELF